MRTPKRFVAHEHSVFFQYPVNIRHQYIEPFSGQVCQGRFGIYSVEKIIPEGERVLWRNTKQVDGLEATRLIREGEQASGRRVPIVAMTANAFAEDKHRCDDAGMNDFIAKPVDADTLLVLLDAGADPVPLAVAIDSAREKDMAVLLLCGRSAPGLVERLLDTDVLISVPHDRPARILEMQLLVIHALCDGLDALLLGEEESE